MILEKTTKRGMDVVKLAGTVVVLGVATDLAVRHTGWTADHVHAGLKHVGHWAMAVGHWFDNAGQTIIRQL